MGIHPSNIPIIYNLQQRLFGERHAKSLFINQYLEAKSGQKILDIGCGTGEMLSYMPDGVDYTGFDLSQEYIDYATKHRRHSSAVKFICMDVNKFSDSFPSQFDACYAVGVLHHLDDNSALELCKIAKKVLKKGGRLCTMDPVFTNSQGWLERKLLENDRGEFIRNAEQYQSIIKTVFPKAAFDIRTDLLRLPYTKIIFKCDNNDN